MYVVEFSCPVEKNMSLFELLSELRQMYPEHGVKLVVLVMEVLGGVNASLEQKLLFIPVCRSGSYTLVCRIQKACLLGSLRILKTHSVVL